MALFRLIATLGCALATPVVLAQAVANPFDYSRTSSFTYRADGLLETETVEPDLPDQCVKTTHGYDGRGNKNAATVAGCAGASARAQFQPRSSGSNYDGASGVTIAGVTVTPPNGSFAVGVTNALGHTESRSYDARFGTVLTLTGPNGLSTTQTVDDFGRAIRETRADGTRTETEHCIVASSGLDTTSNTAGCGGTAPLSGRSDEIPAHAISYLQTVTKDAAGTVMGPTTRVYKDRAGRTVREIAELPLDHPAQPGDRRWVVKDTKFSATGVAVLKTQAYFLGPNSSNTSGSEDYGLEVTSVDALGRPTQLHVADPQGQAGSATLHGVTRVWARTTIGYQGLVTTTTNPKGQTRTEEKNVEGLLVRVSDAYGGQLAHQHDAFGNLMQTKDALQNLVGIGYDVRGRKLSLNDPDTGAWAYDYNALGELVWQQSPNQRNTGTVTTMAYDKLGRMTQRVEPEYTSSWYHDKDAAGAACGKSIGKLCESTTSHGVTKKQHYDPLGRPDWSRTLVANGPGFESWLRYDGSTGRVNRRIYPSRLAVDYTYTSRGALQQVRLANPGSVSPWPAAPGGAPAAGQAWGANTRVLWTAGSVNAWGRPASSELGNGVQARATYEAATGRVLSASAGPGSTNSALHHDYTWDALNNLATRIDRIGDGQTGEVSETYGYDSLNRLSNYTVAAPAVPHLQRSVTLAYNAIGNLLYKSDVGSYSYPAYGNDGGATRARPHGVTRVAGTSFGTVDYGYDANGNVISASAGSAAVKWRTMAYTSFNLPDSQQGVAGPGGMPRSTWQYDENHQRIKEVRVNGSGTRTTWTQHPDNQGGLAFESETAPGGAVSQRHYVSIGVQTVVLVSTAALPALGTPTAEPPALQGVALVKMEFWLKDHLGSVTTTLDHLGNVTARYAYDPFGKRRQTNGQYDAFGTLVIDWADNVNHGTDRGFTGHEHLDELGLIHMNGRLYDPTIARFLQGDPFVQAPDELQNYNRYTYCYNNPLNCSDPTGYSFLSKLWKRVLRPLVAIAAAAWFGPAIIAGNSFFGAGALISGGGAAATIGNAAIAGFISGAISTGTIQGALQGAFSGAVFAGAGEIIAGGGAFGAGISDAFGQIALHGVAGCITSVAGGGKCGPGALSAAFSKAALPVTAQFGDGFGRVLAHSVVGGTASVLGGGKFANGAQTGAFSYLFNHLSPKNSLESYSADDQRMLPVAYGERQLFEIRTHLDDLSMDQYGVPFMSNPQMAPERAMYDRLVAGKSSHYDGAFFRHELTEARITRELTTSGLSFGAAQSAAHLQALHMHGDHQYHFYHPSVVHGPVIANGRYTREFFSLGHKMAVPPPR